MDVRERVEKGLKQWLAVWLRVVTPPTRTWRHRNPIKKKIGLAEWSPCPWLATTRPARRHPAPTRGGRDVNLRCALQPLTTSRS